MPVLFGYSLDDPDFRAILSSVAARLGANGPSPWVLLPHGLRCSGPDDKDNRQRRHSQLGMLIPLEFEAFWSRLRVVVAMADGTPSTARADAPHLALDAAVKSRLCVVHENCDVHPVRDSELGEKARDVGLDGGLAHEQRCGNLGVGCAGPDRSRHLTLPVSERRQALGSEATAI